jgi:hypothetical protein
LGHFVLVMPDRDLLPCIDDIETRLRRGERP